jgi:hypothetical protein
VRHAEIDKARFLVAADDVDREPQRALGVRQKLVRVRRYPESIGGDRAHGRRMHTRKTLAKALQALDRAFIAAGLILPSLSRPAPKRSVSRQVSWR